MKERYEIIKSLYKDYLILFKVKDKIKYYGIDKEIVKYYKEKNMKNINKIVLNNLYIEEIKEYEDNLYNIYYTKYRLIKLIKEIVKNEE